MVYVFLADGFEEVEAIAPVDVLRRAGCEVQTVGVTGMQVRGAHDIVISCDISPEQMDLGAMEMLVLPGGMPGAQNLNDSPVVQQAIDYAVENDRWIGAICAAPMILGKKGLLSGRKATCYPGYEKHLTGALLGPNGVYTDGKFITGKGVGVALKFGLALAQALRGSETAKSLGEAMQCPA